MFLLLLVNRRLHAFTRYGVIKNNDVDKRASVRLVPTSVRRRKQIC